MAVDAGVPVIATIERRVIDPWLHCQRTVRKRNACLVRELTLHAAERQFGEMLGAGQGEAGLAVGHLILQVGIGLGRRCEWSDQRQHCGQYLEETEDGMAEARHIQHFSMCEVSASYSKCRNPALTGPIGLKIMVYH